MNTYKIHILVPFRHNEILENKPHQNRNTQLKNFKSYMTEDFLPDIISNFRKDGIKATAKITIIKQTHDSKRFNRGALLNVGFIENADDDADAFIFHDVDLLPNENMKEYYAKKYKPTDIVHFAGAWNRYSNRDYIGGVTLIGKDVFKRINGFPNDYWGWGGEDDEIRRRLQTNNLYKNLKKIRVTDGYLDLENIPTAKEKRDLLKTKPKELDNIIRKEQAEYHFNSWKTNGLNNNNFYKIVNK